MSVARKIAFVCLHGSAKSLIAAEYLNRTAQDRGLFMTATTAGPEPAREVPPDVIAGLLRHGINARKRVPERVTAAALARSDSFLINGLKREELIAANSMILHEHFFNAIGGDGQPSGALEEAIKRDFGSGES